jgi:signal peptidase I
MSGAAVVNDGSVRPATPVHPFVRHVRTVTVSLFALLATVTVLLAFASRGPSVAGFGLPGREMLIVTSGSMSPAFRTGDAITVKRLDPGEAARLSPGTVVTFRPASGGASLITHRIVGARTSAGGRRVYTTKGDANASPDTADLDPARIVGVLDRTVPRLGYVLNALQQRGVILMLALAALLGSLATTTWPRTAATDPIPQQKENQ